MPVKPCDFLLVNFTLKVKESGETVDTTYDAVAKDARLHREDSTYGPRFIILGEGWLPKGLEDSLVGVDIGKQTTVELPPEKGYGARDPSKMKLVPLRRFRDKETPLPGERIELDGRPAVVRAVGAGRVQVDYNHPLAGRTPRTSETGRENGGETNPCRTGEAPFATRATAKNTRGKTTNLEGS